MVSGRSDHVAGSLDDGPGDGRLAAGEQPAGGGGCQRDADDYEDEGEHRDPTEVAEVVEVRRCEREVGEPRSTGGVMTRIDPSSGRAFSQKFPHSWIELRHDRSAECVCCQQVANARNP